MATRCQIIVEGSDVVLYRHNDGNPDGKGGVIAALQRIVPAFLMRRGFDKCYMPAQIIAGLIGEHHKWAAAVIRKCKKEGREQYVSSYETSKYLGFAVEAYKPDDENAFHDDIEFLYVIAHRGDKTVIEVRECFDDPDGPSNLGNTKLLKTVKVKTAKKVTA